MPLRLKLKPNERVILGGAVVRNGDARCELTLENEVTVLRARDVVRPSETHTPCERVQLALQLAYVDSRSASEHLAAYRALAAEVRHAAPSLGALLDAVDTHVVAGDLYQAIKSARAMVRREHEILSHVR